jgi:predicted transcriptional regulator
VGETDTRKATYAIQVACQTWNKSHVRGHVRLVRAASSHYATKIQSAKEGNNMIINAHISMCTTRAKQQSIDMALIPLKGS